MNERICQWTIGHGVLIHSILFEVRHHISKSCLSGRLSSLLLYFVHLLQVLLRHWVQLGSKAILSLQWSGLRLGHLVHFETTSHSRVHHDFARSLDFLQTVECDIV